MGEAGEAQNITHQQKKMNVEAIRRFRDRFDIPVPDDKLEEVPYVKFAEGSPELEYMRARRMELGGYLPARRRKAEALPIPRDQRVRAVPQEHRRARDLDDDGVRADPADAAARQDARQAHRARSCPTSRGRSAWKACSASSDLEPARAALHAGGQGPADVLQGGQARPDPAGRHQRSRRDVRLDGGGDELLDARRADDPVLHLLFDVRLPARRRSRVGGGRHALPRLPARRHRGPHDAERRRAAARGRPLARAVARRFRTAFRTTRRSPTRSR